MRRVILSIAVLLTAGISTIWAESGILETPLGNKRQSRAANPLEQNTSGSSVRYVKAPRFARGLVEKWITEYAKTQPHVEFQIAKGSQGQADLTVVVGNPLQQGSNTVRTDGTDGTGGADGVVYFGETAVLPITTRSSEAARLLEGKHLSSKKLKQLYFLNDDLEEDVKKIKQFEKITVYSGSNATSVASSFAQNFGEETSNFRGKRISGDDLFLNTALSKDPLGVSFNTLPNIFDLKSRHVKDDLSLIGLDLKKDLGAHFTDEASLDEILLILENGKIPEVAVGKVGVSYNTADDAVNQFLQWILTDGTKWNHEYGLQNLDRKETNAQIEKVKTYFTAQK